MMRIDIVDVGHGSFSLITCPNGTRIMIDCGKSSDSFLFPSAIFAGSFIDLLVFSNLDEDHVADLPALCDWSTIGSILSNPSVTAGALSQMKSKNSMGPGIQSAHAILQRYGAGLIGERVIDAGSVNAWYYYNSYGIDFSDTNNLSLAFFVRYGNFTILFAGDLETAGWKSLLRYPNFCRDLRSVNILVASHHGRENGRCEEVFDYCAPDAVLFSDGPIQYQTQDTSNWYRSKSIGLVPLNSFGQPLLNNPKRHVFTTRNDKSMRINVPINGNFILNTNRMVKGFPTGRDIAANDLLADYRLGVA